MTETRKMTDFETGQHCGGKVTLEQEQAWVAVFGTLEFFNDAVRQALN